MFGRDPIQIALRQFIQVIKGHPMDPVTAACLAITELCKLAQTTEGQKVVGDIITVVHGIHDFIHHKNQDAAAPKQ